MAGADFHGIAGKTGHRNRSRAAERGTKYSSAWRDRILPPRRTPIIYLKRSQHVMEQLWGNTRELRERMLEADFPD